MAKGSSRHRRGSPVVTPPGAFPPAPKRPRRPVTPTTQEPLEPGETVRPARQQSLLVRPFDRTGPITMYTKQYDAGARRLAALEAKLKALPRLKKSRTVRQNMQYEKLRKQIRAQRDYNKAAAARMRWARNRKEPR